MVREIKGKKLKLDSNKFIGLKWAAAPVITVANLTLVRNLSIFRSTVYVKKKKSYPYLGPLFALKKREKIFLFLAKYNSFSLCKEEIFKK